MLKELELFQKLAAYLLDDEKEFPVAKPIPPLNLGETLDLELESQGLDDVALENILKALLHATPKTASKRFFNQLFGGRQPKAVLGDLLSVMLNNSMYTYKVAGPQVGVEKTVINKILELIDYGPKSGGTFPTGGSMSNFMAMLMARDAHIGEAWRTGVQVRFVCYTSEVSHYSIKKAASFIGIGTEQVRTIATDSKGKMIPSELDAQIGRDLAEGFTPFFVNATLGTTVLGVYDNLDELAEICKKRQLWLHADGAYGGSVIFSKKYRYLVSGLHKTDSFCLNAHKMLGAPLTCSLLMVQDKKHLNNSFNIEASYLYQTDEDEFNLGKTSFQCGRRNEALKFWTLWKAVGTNGLEDIVDHLFELSHTAQDYVSGHSDYQLYSEKDSLSICFNYQDIDPKALCTGLYEAGELMVGYGNSGDQHFVRLVSINPSNSKEDMLNFFVLLEDYVQKNASTLLKIEQTTNG
jgi:glutamate/tyrosine decarboxylase-like PLP-dependent enzyme